MVTMMDAKKELETKRTELEQLLEARNKANCDTRDLTAADIRREEQIEDLQERIQVLEKQLSTRNA